ncbi:MAG: hypothetical protein HYV29_13185 [Ignavibacteriales bacterium]|nr:hypothetical protein [Ignavibacteriales bacterium]
MKLFVRFLLFSALGSSLYSQNILETHDPNVTLTAEQCYDVIKTAWDGLKKLSEQYTEEIAVKNEFESSSEFSERIRKAKDQYINKVNKFAVDHKLNEKIFSVWMKAELVKYDADNQIYSIKSPTEILIQPKKNDIAVTCATNKYATIYEKNQKGYRRANLRLNTDPEFSWFVNKQTAQSAKNKEGAMYFKLWFSLNVGVNETENQIVLEIVPSRLALMDQNENFTYWSDEIR